MVVDLVFLRISLAMNSYGMDTLEIIIVVLVLLMYIGGIFVTPIIYYYETKIPSDEQHNDDSVYVYQWLISEILQVSCTAGTYMYTGVYLCCMWVPYSCEIYIYCVSKTYDFASNYLE